MDRYINLKDISTPQLIEIRNILTHGARANAETKKAKEFKRLQAENERLKILQSRWQMIADAGLTDLFNHGDEDNKYILSFNDKHFDILLRNLSWATKQAKLAEATKTVPLRIPPIRYEEQPSGIDFIRTALKDRKNGNREIV